MENYKIIENEFENNKEDLPPFYKILKSAITNKNNNTDTELSIFTSSERHQTSQFEAQRFYKNITIFKI